jgi:hypothetical protein
MKANVLKDPNLDGLVTLIEWGDEEIVKRMYEAREIGRRPRGRPRKTWKEGLQEVTRKKGVKWKEVERTVKDREKWKALWDFLCTGR